MTIKAYEDGYECDSLEGFSNRTASRRSASRAVQHHVEMNHPQSKENLGRRVSLDV